MHSVQAVPGQLHVPTSTYLHAYIYLKTCCAGPFMSSSFNGSGSAKPPMPGKAKLPAIASRPLLAARIAASGSRGKVAEL